MKDSTREHLILVVQITLADFLIKSREELVDFFLNAVGKNSETQWIAEEPGVRERLIEVAYDEGKEGLEKSLRSFFDDTIPSVMSPDWDPWAVASIY